MPIINRIFPLPNGQPGSGALHQQGPWIEVDIALPTVLEQHLRQSNQTVPPSVRGKALIDTGATFSCVEDIIIRGLGVSPIGLTTSGTAGGPAQQYLYPARFIFPGMGMTFEFSRTVGVNLSGSGYTALIGRDVLAVMHMVYNGPLGVVTLSI